MSALSQLSPAERYREIAAAFSARVTGTRDWDAPTPVAEWTARDVVGHLTGWFPAMVEGGTDLTLVPVPSVADDPRAAWAALDGQVAGLLDNPDTARTEFTHEHIGTLPLEELVDRYFTTDVFFHTWDLARATGQDDRLDPDFVAEVYEGMSAQADMIRGSGQFGEQQPVPADATTQEELFAFLGRDPRWAPPTA